MSNGIHGYAAIIALHVMAGIIPNPSTALFPHQNVSQQMMDPSRKPSSHFLPDVGLNSGPVSCLLGMRVLSRRITTCTRCGVRLSVVAPLFSIYRVAPLLDEGGVLLAQGAARLALDLLDALGVGCVLIAAHSAAALIAARMAVRCAPVVFRLSVRRTRTKSCPPSRSVSASWLHYSSCNADVPHSAQSCT
jgi:hypothetical protein